MTTPDERAKAVAIARRILDINEPLLWDVGETELLAKVLLDLDALHRYDASLAERSGA